MPYLYQIDPQWADAEYCGGSFAEQGCGPTALTMVYVYLTGNTDYDPVQMAEFSTEHGYATDGNGSAWTLMSEGASMLGLSSQTLPAVAGQLQAALESGHPIICAMEPGTFTRVGHYIVIEGMASDGTHVLVHDSNSVGRSMRVWDLETICAEAQNIWSFSAA
ncbi:C39 family peptidase [Olsenella uli]|nr:C39 family peptidase [Olsenella uli]MBM6817294.1 C39 family peptidase [Olsenella uli]